MSRGSHASPNAPLVVAIRDSLDEVRDGSSDGSSDGATICAATGSGLLYSMPASGGSAKQLANRYITPPAMLLRGDALVFAEAFRVVSISLH